MPLAFSPSLTVASILLHPYNTDDKTSRLIVKQFSTVRDPREVHRLTWRRGRREIEVTRRKREGVKRGESNLASDQFPMCSPLPGAPREVHKVT